MKKISFENFVNQANERGSLGNVPRNLKNNAQVYFANSFSKVKNSTLKEIDVGDGS